MANFFILSDSLLFFFIDCQNRFEMIWTDKNIINCIIYSVLRFHPNTSNIYQHQNIYLRLFSRNNSWFQEIKSSKATQTPIKFTSLIKPTTRKNLLRLLKWLFLSASLHTRSTFNSFWSKLSGESSKNTKNLHKSLPVFLARLREI